MRFALLGIIFINLLTFEATQAQQPPPSLADLEQAFLTGAESPGTPSEVPKDNQNNYSAYRMEEESNRRLLALSVMGTAIFSLFLVLLYLKNREAPPDTMVHGSGLVLVIFATVLVVILAKVDQQLTAATGILGAIAGYLFGKTAKTTSTEQPPGQTGES